MSIFKKILGTVENAFQIGLSGFRIKNNSAVGEIRTADDSAFQTLRAKAIATGANIADLTTLLDVQGRIPNIEFSFNGASAPSAGSNTSKFGFCHTTGGIYTANDVVYDTGSALLVIPTEVVKHITTKDAISGTVSLIANGLYALEAGSYVLKGDGGSTTTGLIQVIELTVAFGDTTVDSTTSIPSGARIVQADVRVDTAFDGTSPTLQVDVNGGTPLTVQATTDNDLESANQYENSEVQNVEAANAGVVRATLTSGGSTAGSAKVFVYYVTPKA